LGRGPIGLGISPDDKRPIIAYNGSELYSPIPTSELGVIRLPEDEDEFDHEEIFAIERKERRRSATKKIRMILFLMLPVLLVMFHLMSAWMGFGFGELETEAHHDRDDVFHANLWEWSSTHAVTMEELQVPDALTAGGVVPETEVATETLDIEIAFAAVAPIENDTL